MGPIRRSRTFLTHTTAKGKSVSKAVRPREVFGALADEVLLFTAVGRNCPIAESN